MILASSVYFRHQGAERDALYDISFAIKAGQLCCLLGGNGSGKSTLLGLLAGIYTPRQGRLSFAFADRGDCSLYPGAARPKAALVPQDPDLYILGSLVEEDLMLALDPKNLEHKERALRLAADFGLEALLRRPVHTLSHGQKRKLCLASSLSSSPELLLLDEPFAGLDHPACLVMRKILLENKAQGLTQVIAGPETDLAADLADVFIVLEAGRIKAGGAAAEVFSELEAAGVRPPCWWFTGASGPLWQ